MLREVESCGRAYRDQAVLYRTNAQSRLFEEQCIRRNIPYQIVGGVNFYQRREIKDILAYMKLIANEEDDVAFERIINVPRRGIGAASLEKLRRCGPESLRGLRAGGRDRDQREGTEGAPELSGDASGLENCP